MITITSLLALIRLRGHLSRTWGLLLGVRRVVLLLGLRVGARRPLWVEGTLARCWAQRVVVVGRCGVLASWVSLFAKSLTTWHAWIDHWRTTSAIWRRRR